MVKNKFATLHFWLYRYREHLQGTARAVGRLQGNLNNVMFVNLGPAWSNGETYDIFGKSVIEVPNRAWECPPGLGICPLDVLFMACMNIHRWLILDPDHVVVSFSKQRC